MALHFDYSTVTPYEGMTVKGREKPMGGYTPDPDGPDEFVGPLLNAMIWETLAVGIPRITAENYHEFYARSVISERLNEMKPRFTVEDVRKHIGLATNVSVKTRQQFLKDIGSEMDRMIKSAKRKEQSKQEEVA